MSANIIAVCKNQLAPGIQNKVFSLDFLLFCRKIIKINFAQAKRNTQRYQRHKTAIQ